MRFGGDATPQSSAENMTGWMPRETHSWQLIVSNSLRISIQWGPWRWTVGRHNWDWHIFGKCSDEGGNPGWRCRCSKTKPQRKQYYVLIPFVMRRWFEPPFLQIRRGGNGYQHLKKILLSQEGGALYKTVLLDLRKELQSLKVFPADWQAFSCGDLSDNTKGVHIPPFPNHHVGYPC